MGNRYLATQYLGQSVELAASIETLAGKGHGVTLFCDSFGHWDGSLEGEVMPACLPPLVCGLL